MKLNKLARSLALMGLGASALGAAYAQAQDQDAAATADQKAPQKLEKVEVTGSSIKRIQDEGALPIQVIKAADMVKQGITNAEQLLAQISANGNGIDNLATNQGGDFLNSTADRAHNNGASGASLRGFGAQYTLVLLNGRRVSSYGLNGSSVDLNSIPLAALDRVEILKDGASAIYGTDAIGGVINFILKKNYQGLEASASEDATQHGGGDIYRASLLFGKGDLEADRFNVMASLTANGNGRLRGAQRSFQDGYQPNLGLSMDTTGTPFANIGVGGGTALAGSYVLPGQTLSSNRVNLLALQGQCNAIPNQLPYRGDLTGYTNANNACDWDYGKAWSLMQPVHSVNLVSRAEFAVAPEHTVFAEFTGSRVKTAVEYTPIQLTSINLPTSSPYYENLAVLAPQYFKPTNTDPTDPRVFFDASKPERIRWRCMECGFRQEDTTATSFRALVGAEGTIGTWDYKVGLSSSKSRASTLLGDGMMYDAAIKSALASGVIDPFLMPGQTQTPQALALIDSAKAKGLSLYGGQASTNELDGVLSGELMKLPAGALSAAVGVDLRREGYRFDDQEDGASIPAINGVTSPASLAAVGRTIGAVYGELLVPVVKDLELQLAARYDHYSDFGSTTNPKVALRWQPVRELGFRSSYSTGFHAPDFDALYGGQTTGQFNSDINDPLLCPTGKEPTGCAIRPDINTVSNPNLKPETSRQLSFGVLFQPAAWLSGSLDFWQIELNNRIGTLSGQLLVARYAQYSQYVNRDPVTNEITSVTAPYLNLAGDKARGVDVSLNAVTKNNLGQFVAHLDGSYLGSFKSRFSDADPWSERVGQFGDTTYGFDLHLRWKHTLSLSWSQGPWSSSLTQVFNTGYNAPNPMWPNGFTPPQAPTHVASYTLYNLTASYTGFKNLTLTGGIKNLFDTKPPFSAHNVDDVAGAGWDARVGDPRLRSLVVQANYKFW
ncbi:MAG: TonB-dependent receptor [Pelomonas sp.]|nr:TonB-dependent receptor [Roseateles sp.]